MRHFNRYRVACCSLFTILAGGAAAQQTINLPPDTFPDQGYFDLNPGTQINVNVGGRLPQVGSFNTPFDLNDANAVVNVGGRVLGNSYLLRCDMEIRAGGLVESQMSFGDGCGVVVTGGTLSSGADFQEGSILQVMDGVVGQSWSIREGAEASITGGSIDTFTVYGNLDVSGGELAGASISGTQANVSITGGTVSGSLLVGSTSNFSMSGGSTRNLTLTSNSVSMIDAGIVDEYFLANFDAVVFVNGGEFYGTSEVIRNAQANIFGGRFSGTMRCVDDAVVNLFGSTATLAGNPIDIGIGQTVEITARDGSLLSVYLQDGSALEWQLNLLNLFTLGEGATESATITFSRTRCSRSDLAEPFGILDLQDITAFVTAFSAAESAADLAAPEGVFDLADVVAFVSTFSQPCQ